MKTAKDLKIPFTWDERHPILLDRFFYIPGHYAHCKKEISFFPEQEKPIAIEYCSGNGQWVGEKAKQNHELNWIAVEKKFERARQIWLKMHRENISNLVVVCGEALIFTQYYAPRAIEVYVNFPDPWPKRRHAKHRLIRTEFLQKLFPIVQSGGKITCVTDDAKCVQEMIKEFSKCPAWKFLFNTQEWPDYGRSYFHDLWTEKGRKIYHLSYEIAR